MPRERLEGLDRAFFRFSLMRMAREEGLKLLMPARGTFGYPICPWCGDSEFGDNPFQYAQHVLENHRADLKPYKVKQQKPVGVTPQ